MKRLLKARPEDKAKMAELIEIENEFQQVEPSFDETGWDTPEAITFKLYRDSKYGYSGQPFVNGKMVNADYGFDFIRCPKCGSPMTWTGADVESCFYCGSVFDGEEL